MSTFADTITDLSPSGKICLFLYGRPGVGKTAFIGSSTQRVLILRPPHDHVDSIKAVHVEKPKIKERVLQGWNDMDDAVNYCRDGDIPFDWVWLDSVSLFQDTGLDDIWAGVLATPGKGHRKTYGLDKGEYGVNMERLGLWVRQMVALPGFHFGMTAHPAEMEDPETGELVMMPWVQGKNMMPKMCGAMNVVAHYVEKQDRGKKVRVLRTESHSHYFAKDGFGVIGTLRNPKLDDIVELTKGHTAQPTSRRPRRATKRRRSA